MFSVRNYNNAAAQCFAFHGVYDDRTYKNKIVTDIHYEAIFM